MHEINACACDICAYPSAYLGLQVDASQKEELVSAPGPLGSAGVRHGHRRVRRRRLPPFLGGGWLRVGGRFDGDPILRGGGIVARRRGDAGGGIGGFHGTGSAATHDVLLVE